MFQLKEIEQFPQAHYEIHVGWGYVEEWLSSNDARGKEGNQMGGINLDPDFQRAHVWTTEQQTSYVEFILRGGESSQLLYFNHPNWQGSYEGTLTLVDGKQRLEAVRAFLRGDIKAFGHYLKDMEPNILRKANPHFTVRIAKLQTRKDVLNWYLMINSGGTPHTEEELTRVRDLLNSEHS